MIQDEIQWLAVFFGLIALARPASSQIADSLANFH
jgi:hypothetical protein